MKATNIEQTHGNTVKQSQIILAVTVISASKVYKLWPFTHIFSYI